MDEREVYNGWQHTLDSWRAYAIYYGGKKFYLIMKAF